MKLTVPCPTCAHSLHKGRLWLRGADYVECPTCLDSPGELAMTEHRVRARVQERFVARPGGGLAKTTRLITPWGSSHVDV